MASFGLKRSDYNKVIVHYWPDTRQAVELFGQLRTQWRVGMSGATGLDYGAVYPLMDRLHLSRVEWDRLFSDLRWLEGEALSAMHERD